MLRNAILLEIQAATANAPQGGADGVWLKVFPAGTVAARDGRGPYNSGGLAELKAAIQRTLDRAGKTEVMVDYDHQSYFGVKDGVGGTAKAAGWIREWQVRDDGIWARVAWTDAAAAAIKANEYRYLSPLFTHDKHNNLGVILSVALTNTPAIDDVVAQAARATLENEMDFMAKLRKALGLDDSAGEDAILAAIGKMADPEKVKEESAEAMSQALAPIRKAAGLKVDADAEAIVAGVKALADAKAAAASDAGAGGDDAITALTAELKTTAEELTALKGTIAKEKAEAFVDGAIKQGRVGVKPQRDRLVAMHVKDPAEAEALINDLPILGGGNTIVPNNPPAKDKDGLVALTAEDRELCTQLGLDPKAYAKTLTDERNEETA